MSQITNSRGLDGDSLLWNWARHCLSGAPVGNMAHHIPYDDTRVEICIDHALKVDAMHKQLPWHESMVITAEYPQKHGLFANYTTSERLTAARRWIGQVTGVWLSEPEYRIYLDAFKRQVERVLI